VQDSIRKFRLDKEFLQKPTRFEIEFIHNHKMFLYDIKIHQYKILEEALYGTHIKQENELIFHRKLIDNQIKIEFNERYQKTAQDKYRIELYEKEILKDNVSLLGQLSQSKEGFEIIKECYEWFASRLLFLHPDYSLMKVMLNDESIFQFVKQFVKQFNTGITDFEFQKIPFERFFGDNFQNWSEQLKQELNVKPQIYLGDFFNLERSQNDTIAVKENNEYWVKQLIMYHKNNDKQNIVFKVNEESDGTVRLLDLLTAFYFVLNEPYTIFIDEIDRSIHPYLLKKLLEKFSENHETKGQLIFTTHESNLLDQNMLRQDEIWLVEKNTEGATKLYPMSDFDIRHDLDIRKGYLNGRFGAIPFLGNFKDLNWKGDEATKL
jgi:AAA15 family ATPase/GTPase